ncbi:hypothetical protein MMC14_007373 [Varicellaria rhodocarpa]|nr:hypothetical protein [Varicellaria rhodocarpa]
MSSSSREPAQTNGYDGKFQHAGPDTTRGGFVGVELTPGGPLDVQSNTCNAVVCSVTNSIGNVDYISSSSEEDEMIIEHVGAASSMTKSIIKNMCREYLESFTPPNNSGPDRDISQKVNAFLKGAKFSEEDLEDLQMALHYRLQGAALATEYKDIIGLQCSDCEAFDFEAWQASIIDEEAPEEKWKTYDRYQEMIINADVFDATIPQGWDYSKPSDYFTAVCVESGLGEDDVKLAIGKVLSGN